MHAMISKQAASSSGKGSSRQVEDATKYAVTADAGLASMDRMLSKGRRGVCAHCAPLMVRAVQGQSGNTPSILGRHDSV